jgi:hypothetical protein
MRRSQNFSGCFDNRDLPFKKNGESIMRVSVLWSIGLFGLAAVASGASDYQFSVNPNGIFPFYTWHLASVSSPDVYNGDLNVDNPTINLIVGKRYAVTNIANPNHEFDVIAIGANQFSDAVLLSQGPLAGSLEGDLGINWFDDGISTVEFTVTANLVTAMNAAGLSPGYRCEVHPDTMRGNFNIVTPTPTLPIDFQLTLDASGTSPNFSWRLTSVSSPLVFNGPLTTDNPTINLTLGKRFAVTDPGFGLHPFQLTAHNTTPTSDTVLLAMGATVGSFESNPDVAWSDNGAGVVSFTVTPALAAAMLSGGRSPGYRSELDINTMRGNFIIRQLNAARRWWMRF